MGGMLYSTTTTAKAFMSGAVMSRPCQHGNAVQTPSEDGKTLVRNTSGTNP